MMNKDSILHKLADRNLLEVSRCSKVSYPTVRKIASGQWQDIKYSSIERMSQYLEDNGCKGAK